MTNEPASGRMSPARRHLTAAGVLAVVAIIGTLLIADPSIRIGWNLTTGAAVGLLAIQAIRARRRPDLDKEWISAQEAYRDQPQPRSHRRRPGAQQPRGEDR